MGLIVGRHQWCVFHAATVTVLSLVAAAWTRNPHWPLNIPIGIVVGYGWGLVSWPACLWVRKRVEEKDGRRDC
jgi:hypothetical protein